MIKKKNILIWGGGLRSFKLYNFFNDIKQFKNKSLQVKYIFDPTTKKLTFKHKCNYSNKKHDLKKFIENSNYFIVAIGSNYGMARCLISNELIKNNLKPLNYVHKNSFIDKTSKLGIGIQIEPGAIIQGKCEINDFSIINTSATIDHGTTIGKGCHIMSGAVITGDVKVGNYATVGANATVLPYLTIGSGAYIGAGSVVTHDVKKNEIVIGNPAKKIKNHKHIYDLSPFK
jgi:acetyltransferase EpsM